MRVPYRLCAVVLPLALLGVALIAPGARADDDTRKLAARLVEEAGAFARVAPQLLGQETLHQRALKARPRFRVRVGDAARTAIQPNWQEHDLVSEYTFALFSGDRDAGGAETVHELRQVTLVDGRQVADTGQAQEALAKAITASGDARKIQLLKDFEKHGLLGAVTELGQMVLLFSARDIGRFEFSAARSETHGGDRLQVFTYRQIDGQELSVFDQRRGDRLSRLKVFGEVWVREDNFMPVRITMAASQGADATLIREEATVNYSMSEWGTLVPQSAEHRELRAGRVVMENRFAYGAFHRFGASSDIKFEAAPNAPQAANAPQKAAGAGTPATREDPAAAAPAAPGRP